MKKYLRFAYIPRKTFTSLVEGKKSTEEIAKLCTSYPGDKDVSVITASVVSRCNEVVNFVIMNEQLPAICGTTNSHRATLLEDNYANDFVDEYLKSGDIYGKIGSVIKPPVQIGTREILKNQAND